MGYHQRTFVPAPSSVRSARAFVADLLRKAGAEPSTWEWAELVTSELATNAVVHARTDFDVGVATDGEIVISVCDGDPEAPVLGQPDLTSVGGRGMFLVARTSDAWGIEPTERGKRVWCSTVVLHAA